MMFRSLFFAPLLVSADVEEQSVLLQMKGRAETQVMMQRASEGIGAETLRSLEMGLLAKGGPKNVETARCTYHMKTPKTELYAGKTPCEMIDVLEEVFEESLDHFGDFVKIGDGALSEVTKVVDQSLKNFPDVNLTHTFELNASNLNLQDTKFQKAFVKGVEKKLGSEMNETDIYGALNTDVIFEAASEAFEDHLIDLQENVISLMKGEGLISELPTNITLNVTAMQEAAAEKKGHSDVKKMIDTYAKAKLSMFLNDIGKAVAEYWEGTIDFTGDEDPLDIDWSNKKEVSKAHQSFWLLASGFADDANVEPICTSGEFNAKAPILKKVCKGSSSPKCLDELVYFSEGLNETSDICDVVDELPKSLKGKKFTDAKFVDHCNTTGTESPKGCDELLEDHAWSACKKPKDVTKACKAIAKWQKGAEKREAKEAKRLLKEIKKAAKKEMKACNKACNSEPRSERKTCKKTCKDTYKEAIKTE